MSHSQHHHMHHHGKHKEETETSTTTTISTTISDVITQIVTSVMSHKDHHDHHTHDMHGVHEQHVVYDTHSTGMSDTHSAHDTHTGHAGHAGHGTHEGHSGHGSHHHAAYFRNQFGMSVLLEDWVIDTTSGICLVLLFTAILSIGYQGIKWVRKYLHTNYRDRIHSWRSKEHVVQTMLYSTEFFVSYILMLVVMTYNTWVLLVTIFGLGLGYFLFGLHQGKETCASDCPNLQVDEKNKTYDKNPSAQELMPLAEGSGVCDGCCNDFETVRETDILT